MPLTPMARPNGPLVRELRREKGWSQTELGRRTRRTHAVISYIENGRPVSEALLRQVAKALRADFDGITLPAADTASEDEGEPNGVAA